jgi:pimeloyl-ACP methyl ester carboxylesterase
MIVGHRTCDLASLSETVDNFRTYGPAPYAIAVIHGGPGAPGEMAPVARELALDRGILEPLQTATSLDGQVEELRAVLESHARLPVTLIGHSWGAWLSYIVAARHPTIVAKLLLVASGPFHERYVAEIQRNRLRWMTEPERAEWIVITTALGAPYANDKDALLDRLGALAAKADTFDPIVTVSDDPEPLAPQGDIFQQVWSDAAELRRSGQLLDLGKHIRCPVVAIHGDHDPHPAEGVRQPLSAVLPDFRFVLLRNCGHTPWLERQARTTFYEVIRSELARAPGSS